MFRFAAANLASRPGRTALATLGLTIAIAGMVGLFAIAGGIDALVASSLGRIPGIVVMQAGAPVPLFSVLPAQWAEDIARVDGVAIVNPEVWTRVNLLEGKPVLSPPRLLMGSDPVIRARAKHDIYRECLEQGRFLDEQDLSQPHAVISRQIAEDAGKGVGDVLEVNGRAMTIVGIYHCGSLILDVTIIADIAVVRDMARLDADTVSAFYVEPQEDSSVDEVMAGIQQAPAPAMAAGPAWRGAGQWALPPLSLSDLLQRLTTSQGGPPFDAEATRPEDDPREPSQEKRLGDFVGVTSIAQWGDRFEEFTSDLNLVLTLLTGLGIAIAVSSILNTMMMSVSERTVEFGILRANGWARRDIVRLIICESALVGAAGGLAGVAGGWIAIQVINHIWSDRAHLYAGPLLLSGSLLFSVGVGIAGGLYPALRAARMSPMDAIRRG
ncbi:MAG: ABC transporter permease [Planctomycetaceae bacterium]